jgi:lipoprotein-anchoring transpeptidase ErfK/SrfK
MLEMNRRAFIRQVSNLGAAALVGGCSTSVPEGAEGLRLVPHQGADGPALILNQDADPMYALMYGPVQTELFPIPAVDLSRVDPLFLRREVAYPTAEEPGTIVIDPAARFLYHVQPGGLAMRYGVGVGREGFGWSGVATIENKREWPDWYPPAEMIERQPEIKAQLVELQSGLGVPGGLRNPLGARGLYLWQNNKDTLYRIHGTNEPHTIGTSVSSGCIRMINQDVVDLYARVPLGARVKVLPAGVA